jgi:multidrug efflux system membrane fusion protein
VKRHSFYLSLVAVLLLPGCSEKKPQADSRPAVPVVVTAALKRDIPQQVRVIGTVEAFSSVAVKSLASGELKEIHFREGQEVQKGDLLFSIDPRPLQSDLRRAEANLARDTAQAKQAEANLARDTARLKNAEAEALRQQRLFDQGIVSREEYERVHTEAQALEATVRAGRASIEFSEQAMRADRAAIENAKLQLDYCSIRAPIQGRTGHLIVNPGNMVRVNETQLVTINQISPIYVSFAVPEEILPEIQKFMARGKLALEAAGSNNETQPSHGFLTFVDNSVDSTTGTIRLKGTFPNGDNRLWPGQFVNVILTLSTESGAVVVASQAVQTGQAGSFVFVVNSDLLIESRPVAVGRTYGGEVVIKKGLAAGERVVADGQLRLVPGSKVDIKNTLEAEPATHP